MRRVLELPLTLAAWAEGRGIEMVIRPSKRAVEDALEMQCLVPARRDNGFRSAAAFLYRRRTA